MEVYVPACRPAPLTFSARRLTLKVDEVFAAAVTRVGAAVGATLAELRSWLALALNFGNTVPAVGPPAHAEAPTVMACVAPSFVEYERTEVSAVPSVRVAEVLLTEIVLETAWVVVVLVLAVWAEAKPPAAATARMLRTMRFMLFPFSEATLSLTPVWGLTRVACCG